MSENVIWQERPSDVANLLNPAYCAILLNQVCKGYQNETSKGIPFALAFLALPMLLHTPTLNYLPKSSRTKLYIWLEQRQELLLEYPKRAKSLVPYVKEAISFGLAHKIIQFDQEVRLTGLPIKMPRGWDKASFPAIVAAQGVLVGKMFGQVSDVTSLFSMFGVRP